MTGPAKTQRPIPGYEGLYVVNTFGEVRNRKGHPLKSRCNDRGYPHVWLYKDGCVKSVSVHRLVAMTFIPNPQRLPEVNHINGIKTDNRVENLEWCSVSYNRWHSNNVLLKDSGKPKRRVLCLDTGAVYPSISEAARAVHGKKQNIAKCCQGLRKTTAGLRWAYVKEGSA